MLAKLLRSRIRAKALGWLFTHPDERFFVRQLTALLGEDSTNLSRELARLEEIGVLTSRREGRQKYYQANPNTPVFEELKGLAIKTVGMADVIREALFPVADEIQSAFIFGSQAAKTASFQSDIDLLVVGEVDETALHGAVGTAEDRLHRVINYTFFSPKEFQKARKETAGFLQRVLEGPKIFLIGSLDEL